jgi:hypothetical protein
MPSANSAKDETLIKNLEVARGILDDAIASLKGVGKISLATRKKVKIDFDPGSAGLPDHILGLRGEGFFQSARSGREVHEKLQTIYSCSADRVAMALLRLQRKKMLRKTSKVLGEKKQVAYVW